MIKDLVALGRLLADPNRLKIIKLLAFQPMCVCELMEVLRLNQSCISQHLTILKYHNLLNARRDGKWIVYEINKKAFGKYLNGLNGFLKGTLGQVAELKTESKRLRNIGSRGLLCERLGEKCKE
jgi:ArsR family transcriptional regulator, arsenate/arsenite/antimonite-responsive transcriptional repressor